MVLQQAKEYFSLGVLTGVSIVPAPMVEGWSISFSMRSASDFVYLAERRSGMPRVFKSLDTALSVVRDIGFKVQALRVA